MVEFLSMGAEGLATVKAALASPGRHFRIAKAAVTLKAPLYNPEKVICVGMNYVDHCTEQNFPIPEEPIIFSKFSNSIIAPGEPVVHSNLTQELDFEVELVIVVGKAGRHIPMEEAMSHVAGYTVAHDVSARDWQMKKNGGQWLLGKTFDSFCPLGPAIVTVDDIKDPHNLGIRCFLNGETVQDSSTNQLIFKTDYLIHWISSFTTLQPGDVILTGTPPGVGCFRKPPLFLKHGDVVRCEIDGIGSITNAIVNDPIIAKL
jgi:2-keto-4-pentenoate hydratase/2-oxohepta-3-ene-1,7-dioic acid hydratase in catechol pathway